ncbi:hypothetical protein FO519_003478 [Halicephalobus sp. NKZ332]|nr:hypothetical protein FO519_003478 [Halicephalobus sp. NKZ332]
MLFIFLFSTLFVAKSVGDIVEGGISVSVKVEASCQFSIHEKGPDGKELTGTSLDTELYYKIKCKPEPGYCLKVSNCTVTGEGKNQKPYPIIDENGCTKEPSLFEHVQYLDDFTAGIPNPIPIRFRGPQSGVKFECATTLISVIGHCEHQRCVANEYSKESNLEKP